MSSIKLTRRDTDVGAAAETVSAASLYDCIRFAAAAPFSKAYRGRLRWLLEASRWEAEGIAVADIRRKAVVVPGTGAIFLAVSKAANTSLSFILSTKAGVNRNNVHKKRFAPQRLVDTGRTLSDLADGSTPIFTFVRHPVTRFWSAFADKIVSARARRGGGTGTLAGLATPEDVVDYVANTPVTAIDEHFRPQWSSTAIERLPLAFVGKVETIRQHLEALVARGLLTREQVDRLPHFNAKRPVLPANKEVIDRRLREIYRKDLELFGYV